MTLGLKFSLGDNFILYLRLNVIKKWKMIITTKNYFRKIITYPWPVWLSWLEHHPINLKGAGMISSKDTCLGCGFAT